ncbi:MAG: hypothetical protein LUM44_02430 [Pyrinomonadaceae bacterium]|nr:hypothetical protein [Pyrinomonadaceae bacterium]
MRIIVQGTNSFGNNRQLGPNHNSKAVGPIWIDYESIQENGVIVAAGFANGVQRHYHNRPVWVRGIIVASGGKRGPHTPEPAVGHLPHGYAGDVHRGHVFAIHNGGVDDSMNIVPQWGAWQAHGIWRRMERRVHNYAVDVHEDEMENGYAANSDCVYFSVKLQYPYASYDAGWNLLPNNRQVDPLPAFDKWGFPSKFRIDCYLTAGLMANNNGAAPASKGSLYFEGNELNGYVMQGAPQGIQ